jgi:HD-like signal output (HDOD) protein
MATAAGSKLLCDQLKLGLPDEAFLAGLIHDIGIMVEMQASREKLLQVFDKMRFDSAGVPQTNMREIETQTIGADHCLFGAALCESWKFPKSFAHVAGHHHDPLSLPSGNRMLATVVHVADIMSAECKYGFRADLPLTLIDPHVLEELRITAPTLESIKSALPRIFDEVQSTFG